MLATLGLQRYCNVGEAASTVAMDMSAACPLAAQPPLVSRALSSDRSGTGRQAA